MVCNLITVGLQFGHETRNFVKLLIEPLRGLRIDIANQVFENNVARDVVGRIARPASLISACLTPAIFSARQAVMASEAIQLPVFWPDLAFCATRKPIHAL